MDKIPELKVEETLSLNGEYYQYRDEETNAKYYEFTPEESGTYYVYFDSEDFNAEFYKSDRITCLDKNYVSNSNDDTVYSWYLEKGETYYLSVILYMEYSEIDFGITNTLSSDE
jgi:hypothetical protein